MDSAIGHRVRDDRAWVESTLRALLGPSASVVEERDVPTRVAQLSCLTVLHGGTISTYYLKYYEPDPPDAVLWSDHCAHLMALDISQALLELDEFMRVSPTFPIPGLRARAEAAFRCGYDRPLPAGSAFWLPHLRNLAVAAATLAPLRRARPRWLRSRRYHRVVDEIRRTVRSASLEL